MAQPRKVETLRREAVKLSKLRGGGQFAAGALWALQWAIGVRNARAVSLVIRDEKRGKRSKLPQWWV